VTDTVAYLRVSTEEQARGDHTSLAQQRAASEQLAQRLGRTIGRWFEDPGASGGSANRPGFQALAAFCRSTPLPRAARGVILCFNHSRWGRFPDANDATWWAQEMKHVGWTLRFAEGGEMEDTPAGPVLNSLQWSQATVYREALRATARRGSLGTASKGLWGTEAPFGYRREAIAGDGRRRVLELGQEKSKDERAKLTPGPEDEVRLVRWLFREYAKGELSCERLADLAYQRHPSKKWSKQVVRALLQNPAYAGDVVWGRRMSAPGAEDQVRTDPAAWTIVRDAHPALVGRPLFDQVQARFQLNRGKTRLSAGGYPLSGLLTCAHCGDTLIGGGGPKGPAEEPNRYRFYRHALLSNPKPFQPSPVSACPALMATLPKRIVEPAVIAAVADLVGSSAMRTVLERAADRLLARLAGAQPKRADDVERRRAKLLAERDRLVKLAGSETLSEEEVAPRIRAIRAELAALEGEGTQLRFSQRRLQTIALEKIRLVEKAANFSAAVASATGPKLRELLRMWVHSAVADRVSNILKLTIYPLPLSAGFLHSANAMDPDSQAEAALGPFLRRAILLPAARSMRRKRFA